MFIETGCFEIILSLLILLQISPFISGATMKFRHKPLRLPDPFRRAIYSVASLPWSTKGGRDSIINSKSLKLIIMEQLMNLSALKMVPEVELVYKTK